MTDLQPLTVLYADDEHANRVVFTQTFKHRFRVETVADGAAALERLARDPAVAVLVADQRMPGMSGTELLRRAREAHPTTQRIMVTAYEDPKPILEVLNSGLAIRYILKPWVREEVEAALAGALELHRLRKDKIELEMRFFQGERFTTLGSIAAGVFHDLKQPLTVLSASLDLLRRYADLARELGARVERGEIPDIEASGMTLSLMAKDLPELAEDTHHSTRLMRSLNDSARSFLGQRDESSIGHPDAAVRSAVRLCDPQIRAHGNVLAVEVPERGIPPTPLSTTGLTQVLVNVLVNASQALAAGRDGKITLSVDVDEEGVRFRVRDNGTGMTPAVLSRVREPFFTTKEPGVGTGLGLYTTQRLVDAAGGRMTLESVEHEGTTVAIWLPRLG